ncbi:LysR family transcriptional regulator [Micromonospora sp. WMMD998]|uniref:LysR family transcriptional regulator n=1 Tax=Micromonospora sp. WMMD998 TaxID=3016092 RepID=UPI00249C8C76|nr:LysR family transcriptional regulator [Micromonospora sp. WMMD998]WFE41164.1 LysR family transcriptional regulator [Micromonospora sp. WMMD998]
MDARQLQALLMTADVGSFTRAAARLGVTQPTITNRIKALEQALDTILLERLPGGVRPTRSGQAVLPYAREIVRLSAEMEHAVTAPGEPRGRVAVGSLESLTNHRLLPLIEYLHVRYPGIEFSLHASDPWDSVSRVRSGQLDCAFLIGAALQHDDLEVGLLCPEPLALVTGCHPASTGAAGAEGTGPSFGTVLLCSDVDVSFCKLVASQAVAGATRHRRTLKLNSIEAAKHSAANGIGVALLPEVAVAREIAEGTLRRVDWEAPERTYTQAVWRRSKAPDPALEVVLAAARKVVRED